jgi:hypothetical protein
MYKIPFQLLCNHLREIEEIKAVQAYRGQDRQEGALTTEPTVTIRFMTGSTETIGNYIEEVTQQIEIRIITAFPGESDRQFNPPAGKPDHDLVMSKINKAFREKYFKLSDLPEFAELADTPADKDYLGTLMRRKVDFQIPVDKKLVTNLVYECMMYDYSASPVYTPAEVGFEVTEYVFLPES